MVEVATLEQKEAFADLWHRCFGDSEVFTKWLFEKRFLPDFSTYIKRDNKIVCCMQAYPLHIWVRGKVVKGVMLCGVCTDKEYRRQGLMTELFSETMKMLREKGFVLAVHTPAVLHSYDSFGHIAVNSCQYITSDNIPAIKKSECIQEMTQNFHMLYSCYDKFSQNYSGCISRTMADFLLKIEDYQADGATIIVYQDKKNIKGYSVFYHMEDRIQAVETVAENDNIYQKLVEGICCYGVGKHLSVKLPEDVCIHSFQQKKIEKGVAGVLNVQQLLSILGQKQGYTIAIKDTIISQNNGIFDLDGTPSTKAPDITLSAGEATQFLLGYHSLSELQKKGSIQRKEQIQEIEHYYPKQKCYIIDEY